MSQPTIAFEKVTPELALDLLGANKKNRSIRSRTVEKYARDMAAGRWRAAGEPVLIASDGTVGNGQHRLMAVLESDCTVVLPVIRGAAPHVRAVADQGLRRTFADVLKIEFDEGNPQPLAAAVRQVHQYRLTGMLGVSGGSGPAAQPSIDELVQCYQEETGLSDSLKWIKRCGYAGVRLGSGLIVALHYLFSEVDADDADAFWEKVVSGADLKGGDPILSLRRYVMGNDRPRSVKTQAAVVIKAFNYWREGREVQNLRWRGGGAAPEKFPEIER